MRTSGNFHTEWLYFFFPTRWMAGVLAREAGFKSSAHSLLPYCAPSITHTAPCTAYPVITSAASALRNNWVIVLLHQWGSCKPVRIMSLTFAWKGNHDMLVISHSWECNCVVIVGGAYPTPLTSFWSPISVNGSLLMYATFQLFSSPSNSRAGPNSFHALGLCCL